MGSPRRASTSLIAKIGWVVAGIVIFYVFHTLFPPLAEEEEEGVSYRPQLEELAAQTSEESFADLQTFAQEVQLNDTQVQQVAGYLQEDEASQLTTLKNARLTYFYATVMYRSSTLRDYKHLATVAEYVVREFLPRTGMQGVLASNTFYLGVLDHIKDWSKERQESEVYALAGAMRQALSDEVLWEIISQSAPVEVIAPTTPQEELIRLIKEMM